MTMISSRQVAIRTLGNYATLEAFLDRRIVSKLPLIETQVLTVGAVAQFSLLDSSLIAGNIAKGSGSTTVTGGVVAAALPGAVGTASIASIADSNGNILNLVNVYLDSTKDPVMVGGRRVWGLIQCSSAASDGAPIGAVGFENLQVSFVIFDATNSLVLTALSPTVSTVINFTVNKLYSERNRPTLYLEGGIQDIDVIDASSTLAQSPQRRFTVTGAFLANEIITLATGAGATAGTSTPAGDTVVLVATSPLFIGDSRTVVTLNGVIQRKGVDVIWDSTTTLHFAIPLDIADVFDVQVAP
jgi:hypothetical protein